MGQHQVLPNSPTHHWDGTPKSLAQHPNPWFEYVRQNRTRYPFVNRGQKIFFGATAYFSILYGYFYAYDQYYMYSRLIMNIHDYKANRTKYLDLPDGYLTKLHQQAEAAKQSK
eukprot:TRINITY_DN48148_c0_g1_i1.p1 TRINITY_DN48148_c0_g1~~TRINITY_DN48148_c0_g1_i1.p1  ORF type:complete len:113 (+),score=7.63 TRINITY_DN48148_c0_g1_i1:65-403(+)